jgi:uncharacterized protein (UPF0335 family)
LLVRFGHFIITPMNELSPLVDTIVRRQAEWVSRWHEKPTAPETDLPLSIVEQNHLMNFGLWHAEDTARRDDLGDDHVKQAKRTIDRCNQSRNDAIEKLDEWFLNHLPPAKDSSPLHSETAGMIVDRLSIMALKIYHMKIEATRETAMEESRRKCSEKLARLEEQLADLKQCLKELLAEMQAGTRRFKIYRQMKMYNDAALNPQLYAKGG